MRCLAAQPGMRLAFWLYNSASAYSAFAFQKGVCRGFRKRWRTIDKNTELLSKAASWKWTWPKLWVLSLLLIDPRVPLGKSQLGLFHMHMWNTLDSWDKEATLTPLFTQSVFIRYLKCARLTSRTFIFSSLVVVYVHVEITGSFFLKQDATR